MGLVEMAMRTLETGVGFVSWKELMLLAGGDMTASLLSHISGFELSDCPDIWKRLQREVAKSLDDGDESSLSKIPKHEVSPGRTR